MSENPSKLSFSEGASNSFTKQNNSSTNRFTVYENYCYHFGTKGKLIFDLEKSKLKFSVTEERSIFFKKKYEDIKEFEILKSDIESCDYVDSFYDKGKEQYLFRIKIRNIHAKNNGHREEKIFVFYQEPDKDNKKIRDHFVNLIKGIKSEFI